MVLKVNLETGTALELFPVADTVEIEGLAIRGETIQVLAIAPDGITLALRHWKRTRISLRDQVCR